MHLRRLDWSQLLRKIVNVDSSQTIFASEKDNVHPSLKEKWKQMNEKSKWPHRARPQPLPYKKLLSFTQDFRKPGVKKSPQPQTFPEKVPNRRVRVQIPLEFLRGGA